MTYARIPIYPVYIAITSLLMAMPLAARVDARTDMAAADGDTSPDGVGLFVGFDAPTINNSGQMTFGAVFDGAGDDRGLILADSGSLDLLARTQQDPPAVNFTSFGAVVGSTAGVGGFKADILDGVDLQGIYTSSVGVVTEIAREGSAVPGTVGGTYTSFDNPSINPSGQVAFWAQTNLGSAILTGTTSPASLVVIAGQDAPDMSGMFDSFASTVSINSHNEVAFLGFLTGTTHTQGVFRGTDMVVDQIARIGQEFETGRTFTGFGGFSDTVALNDDGKVAFRAAVDQTGDGVADTIGLYVGSLADVTPVAERGDASPDGNGTLHSFNNPAMNNSGVTAFVATISGSSGGSSDNVGIFTGMAGGTPQKIARKGDSVPSGNGKINEFGTGSVPSLSEGGQVMFFAQLAGTDGGVNDDEAIFIADSQEMIEVTREGAPLAGSTVLKDGLEVINNHDPGGRSALNNRGQVAFTAKLQDGSEGVFVFTPELQWRSASDGDWDSSINWTVGLVPAEVHDVQINPSGTVVVNGPSTATSVRSLDIGGDGGGSAALVLQPGVDLTVSDELGIAANGQLNGSGVLGGDLINDGLISPGNSPGIVMVDGGYEQGAGGILRVELAGADNSDPSNPQYDQLVVTGDVSLGGRLEAVLDGGYIPIYGDTFDVMTFASRGGTLFDVTETLIDTSLGLAPVFSDEAVTLRATVPGDLNFDDMVSVADLSTFALNFGTTPGIGRWDLGDFNGDGGVTVADLSLLALNFGFSLSSPAIGLSIEDAAVMVGLDPSEIPEPNSLAILAGAALLAGHRQSGRYVGYL